MPAPQKSFPTVQPAYRAKCLSGNNETFDESVQVHTDHHGKLYRSLQPAVCAQRKLTNLTSSFRYTDHSLSNDRSTHGSFQHQCCTCSNPPHRLLRLERRWDSGGTLMAIHR